MSARSTAYLFMRFGLGHAPEELQLREVELQGVDVISCRTCVEYFNLKEKVRVGTVGGMAAIMEAMARADKVVSV